MLKCAHWSFSHGLCDFTTLDAALHATQWTEENGAAAGSRQCSTNFPTHEPTLAPTPNPTDWIIKDEYKPPYYDGCEMLPYSDYTYAYRTFDEKGAYHPCEEVDHNVDPPRNLSDYHPEWQPLDKWAPPGAINFETKAKDHLDTIAAKKLYQKQQKREDFLRSVYEAMEPPTPFPTKLEFEYATANAHKWTAEKKHDLHEFLEEKGHGLELVQEDIAESLAFQMAERSVKQLRWSEIYDGTSVQRPNDKSDCEEEAK